MSHAAAASISGARQVAANGMALLLAYVIPRAFTVFAVVAAARILGAEAFGTYGSAAALAVMLSVVASLGMHPLLVREIARAPAGAAALISAAHRVKTASGLAMLAAAALLGRALFPGHGQAQAATLVLCVGWVLQAYAENLSAWFQAAERMRRWTEASALFGLVSSVSGVALLLLTRSLVAFSAGFGAGWAAALYWLHRGLPAEARRGGRATRAAVLLLARGTLPFAAAFVALTVYCKVDVLLLRHWRGDGQVGLYTAAYKFVDVFQALVIVGAGAIYPRLARDAGDRGRAPWAGTRSTELLLLGAVPAGLALHLAAHPLVAVLFGAQYVAAGAVLSWIGLLLPLLAISVHSGYVLGASGRIGPMALLYAVGIAVNVALNAWLIPRRGAEGAALARLGSEAAVAAGLLTCAGVLAGAAPRWRAVGVAALPAGAIPVLAALPDATGGWVRCAAFVLVAVGVYAALGAVRAAEVQAVLGLLGRRIARAPAGERAP